MAYLGQSEREPRTGRLALENGMPIKKKGVLTLSLIVTLLCYVTYGFILTKNPNGSSGAKILAMVIFLIVAPIGVWVGGLVGNLICPQIIIANGAQALLKERLFWWIGPRFIGAGVAAIGATMLAVPEIIVMLL